MASSKDQGEKWCFVGIDELFVSELGETLDQYNTEDLPHLVMDVWEDVEYGTVWEVRLASEELQYDVPEDEITIFHRFSNCQDYYNPRDEVLCYFVLAMHDYAKRKETNGE